MRRVQETLSKDGELTAVDQDLSSAPALLALKQKRLTFTWLDGEAQKVSTSLQMFAFLWLNSGMITFSVGTVVFNFSTILALLFIL